MKGLFCRFGRFLLDVFLRPPTIEAERARQLGLGVALTTSLNEVIRKAGMSEYFIAYPAIKKGAYTVSVIPKGIDFDVESIRSSRILYSEVRLPDHFYMATFYGDQQTVATWQRSAISLQEIAGVVLQHILRSCSIKTRGLHVV